MTAKPIQISMKEAPKPDERSDNQLANAFREAYSNACSVAALLKQRGASVSVDNHVVTPDSYLNIRIVKTTDL